MSEFYVVWLGSVTQSKSYHNHVCSHLRWWCNHGLLFMVADLVSGHDSGNKLTSALQNLAVWVLPALSQVWDRNDATIALILPIFLWTNLWNFRDWFTGWNKKGHSFDHFILVQLQCDPNRVHSVWITDANETSSRRKRPPSRNQTKIIIPGRGVDCSQSLSFLLVVERLGRARCATARETGVS